MTQNWYLLAKRQLSLIVCLKYCKMFGNEDIKTIFFFVEELVTVAVAEDVLEISVYELETVTSK